MVESTDYRDFSDSVPCGVVAWAGGPLLVAMRRSAAPSVVSSAKKPRFQPPFVSTKQGDEDSEQVSVRSHCTYIKNGGADKAVRWCGAILEYFIDPFHYLDLFASWCMDLAQDGLYSLYTWIVPSCCLSEYWWDIPAVEIALPYLMF